MKPYKIAVLEGDGIGPEVVHSALRLLSKLDLSGEFQISYADFGGIAIDKHQTPYPDSCKLICKNADAIFLGAIGGPKWNESGIGKRPEDGLLALRKDFEFFANLRPIKVIKGLEDISPLKYNRIKETDILIVRELIGGLYFGKKVKTINDAIDECYYDKASIERICEVACQCALLRSKRIVSVDKANVLATSKLWRETVSNYISTHYPEIQFENALVDSTAMLLISNAPYFDVILTENMFGDILSDLGAGLLGSLGFLPSASLGLQEKILVEPVHGSAPDIAGQGIANPTAAMLSLSMMFRLKFNKFDWANRIEMAIEQTLRNGYFTKDIALNSPYLSTDEFTKKVLNEL